MSAHQPHSLLVGGTRGIGRALARTLLDEGHRVSVIGRREPAPPARLEGVRYWGLDILDGAQVASGVTAIVQTQGKLTNVVFLQRYRGAGDNWAGEMDTSLSATRRMIGVLSDKFEAQADKSIVVIGSIASSLVTSAQPDSYHVAKAGLLGLVRYQAVALGKRGIRVNTVSPCTVLKDESKDFFLQNRPLHDLYRRVTPLGRMGTAEDVAKVVAFLCSEKASFITGQDIVVDGGMSLLLQETLARQLLSLE